MEKGHGLAQRARRLLEWRDGESGRSGGTSSPVALNSMLFCRSRRPATQNWVVRIGRFTIGPELVEELNKVCEENKNKKLSIWVLSVGQSISEYVVSMGHDLCCWYWWKTK